MSLVPHKIVALESATATAISTGKTTIAGAVVIIYDSDNNAITLYDDAAFTNGAASKVTGSTGELIVWITAGEYTQSVNGSTALSVTVGSASPVTVDTFANMLLLRPEQTGQAFTCQERANAPYVLKSSGYVSLAGDATFANGRIAALQLNGSNKLAWFGAALDGVTDDTAILLSSIRSNSTLYLPDNSTCLITGIAASSITNFKLIGRSNSVIKLANAADTDVLKFTSSSNITIKKVTIDGNRTNQTGYYGTDSKYGVKFDTCDFSKVLRCTIKSTRGGGVRGIDCNDTTVEKSYITDVGSWPISIYLKSDAAAGKKGIFILRNTVDWEDQTYMAGNGDPANGWTDNTPPRPICYLGGIAADTDTFKTVNIDVLGNTFYQKNTGAEGGFVAHIAGKNYDDRNVSDNKLYGGGMGVSGGKYCDGSIIARNTIKIPATTSIVNGAYGVEIGANTDNAEVIDNIIFGGGLFDSGIQAQDTCNNIIIAGGHIEGCLDYAVTQSNTGGSTNNTNLTLRPGYWKGGSSGAGVIRIDGVIDSSVTGGILDGAGVAGGAIEYINTANKSSVTGVTYKNAGASFVRLRQSSGTLTNICVSGCSVPVLPAADRYLRNQISGSASIGTGMKYIGNTSGFDILDYASNVIQAVGSGSPEGSVIAGIGSTFRRTNGGAGTSMYIKESGTGNTGWAGI